MNKTRIALALAVALAIPAEGLRQIAYRDTADVITVCYGSTKNVERGKKYSLEECKARLNAEMLAAVETVDKCVPGLPENVLAAFGDAVYNLGPTIACNLTKSTAARHLKAGRLIDACRQLPRWNKASVVGVMIELPGLTTRRGLEKELCMKGLA